MKNKLPLAPLSEVLSQYQEYIQEPELRIYPKLSVKLYGKGVVLDASVDGSTLKMRQHQIAKGGQVILSEIWGKKGAIGFVPLEGEGALCTSHFCNYPGPLRFTQKREEEDDHTESPAKPTTEEDLVCARSTNSHEYS